MSDTVTSPDQSKTNPPSMTEILSNLDKTPAPPSTDEEKARVKLNALSDEEKELRAWEWKMQGIPVPSMAKAFGVTPRQVYRWINQAKVRFREGFEGETAADNLSGHLMALESIEEMCLYQANQLGKDGKEFDPKTGTVVEGKTSLLAKGTQVKFFKLALESRMAQFKLLLDTGVLPKEAERMYHSLEQTGKVDINSKEEVPTSGLDRKQLIGELLHHLDRAQKL